MSIVLDGTSGVIVSGNTNTLSGLTVGRGAGSVATNTAVGASALAANTTGDSLVAVGLYSLASNTSGNYNSAVGRGVLTSNTTGSSNVGVGMQALANNTTASNNTAVGYQAGYNNTTGADGTFIGYQAGYSFTGGAQSGCVYVGKQAGCLTTGIHNTFIGFAAGYGTTSGGQNCFVGGYNPTTGTGSGQLITTGSKNTILGGYNGNQGGLDIRTASNYIVLSDGDGNPYFYMNQGAYTGATLKATGNDMRLTLTSSAGAFSSILKLDVVGGGNGSIISAATLRCYGGNQETNGVYLASGSSTSWSSTSDERLKDIIEPISNAALKLKSWRTVIGKYKTDEDGMRRMFFIAQDVQANAPELVNATTDANGNEVLGLQYTETIPVVAAAVNEHTDQLAMMTALLQELNAKVDAQAAEIAALKGTA